MKHSIKPVEFDHFNSALSYDPKTGIFIWRYRESKPATWNGQFPGKVAGNFNQRGYRQIRLDNRLFMAHRLAWVLMTGENPATEIDHINGVKDDNRWSNLRAATGKENSQNRRVRKDSKSGLKGVSWNKKSRKWLATISVEGQTKYLGFHNTPEDAHQAYVAGAIKYFGEYSNDGLGPIAHPFGSNHNM